MAVIWGCVGDHNCLLLLVSCAVRYLCLLSGVSYCVSVGVVHGILFRPLACQCGRTACIAGLCFHTVVSVTACGGEMCGLSPSRPPSTVSTAGDVAVCGMFHRGRRSFVCFVHCGELRLKSVCLCRSERLVICTPAQHRSSDDFTQIRRRQYFMLMVLT